jgi:hypothetical protein
MGVLAFVVPVMLAMAANGSDREARNYAPVPSRKAKSKNRLLGAQVEGQYNTNDTSDTANEGYNSTVWDCVTIIVQKTAVVKIDFLMLNIKHIAMLFVVDTNAYEFRIRYRAVGYFAAIRPQYDKKGCEIYIWCMCGIFYVCRYIKWIYGFSPMRSINRRLSIKDIASDTFYKYCCEIEHIAAQLCGLYARQDIIAREMLTYEEFWQLA